MLEKRVASFSCLSLCVYCCQSIPSKGTTVIRIEVITFQFTSLPLVSREHIVLTCWYGPRCIPGTQAAAFSPQG